MHATFDLADQRKIDISLQHKRQNFDAAGQLRPRDVPALPAHIDIINEEYPAPHTKIRYLRKKFWGDESRLVRLIAII